MVGMVVGMVVGTGGGAKQNDGRSGDGRDLLVQGLLTTF